jgi:MFS family permease
MIGQNDARLRLTINVLLVVYILNFIDRQIVGILAQPIAKELHLTDFHIGLMTGLAFALFYTGLGIPIARFADRPSTSRVKVIAVCLMIWSAMTALCGAAQTFLQLFLARVGVGIGEAGGTPPAHSLITQLASPAKRASALSFYQLGAPLGGLIAMVLGGYLADSVGWRWAFVVVGAPGVLLSLVVLALLRDPRADGTVTETAMVPRLSFRAAFAHIWASRANRLILLSVAFAATANYGLLIWGPIFLQRSFGLRACYRAVVWSCQWHRLGAGRVVRRANGRSVDQARQTAFADWPGNCTSCEFPAAGCRVSCSRLAAGDPAVLSWDYADVATRWSDLQRGAGPGSCHQSGNRERRDPADAKPVRPRPGLAFNWQAVRPLQAGAWRR